MTPEALALLAVACLVPTAEPPLPDPALMAAVVAPWPGPVASPPAPPEVAAIAAAAAHGPGRKKRR